MARNSEAAHSLSEDLLQDNFTKHYLALVHEVPWESGTIDLPLTNHETREPMDCLTHFKRLAIGDNCALMELTPKTGRRHQLRRHMKKIHHYIVGDTTYGRKSINNIYRSNYEIQRLCLHAWSLSFPHPKTKKIVKFEAPLPEELQSAFRQIPGIAEIINLYC
jgi:23S rRNA-/tRNA-specific pseudouridylate synthase